MIYRMVYYIYKIKERKLIEMNKTLAQQLQEARERFQEAERAWRFIEEADSRTSEPDQDLSAAFDIIVNEHDNAKREVKRLEREVESRYVIQGVDLADMDSETLSLMYRRVSELMDYDRDEL